MLSTPLFRRHYFISLTVIATGLLLSVLASMLVISIERTHSQESPVSLFRKILVLTGKPIQEAIPLINDQLHGTPFARVDYLPSDSPEFKNLSVRDLEILNHGLPIEKHTAMGLPDQMLIQLENNTGLLRLQMDPKFEPGGQFLLINVICLFLGVVVTTGIAIFILFSSYRQRAATAEAVLGQLKSGDLSARLPTQAMDELSDLVGSFNKMADEIEKLVSRIRSGEASRMALLQSLAHDLRTPIASMKTFLESLKEDRTRMTEAQQQRSLDLCLAENSYFERLVENLLVLASLEEPKYSGKAEPLKPEELIRTTIDVTAAKFPNIKIEILSPSPETSTARLRIDPELFLRLLRNGLENALSFANSRVSLSLVKNQNSIEIIIQDDGPGLDAVELLEFGERKRSRRLNLHNGTRVSLGVGSVIMREIVALHGGTVTIENLGPADRRQGALLKITLPLWTSEAKSSPSLKS